MSSSARIGSKQKSNLKPDFEGNLADFDAAFLLFVVESDPNFDITLLQNNPSPSLLTSPVNPAAEQMYPVTKDELTRKIKIKGPNTVNTNIFGDQVVLEDDVRVKGNVYGIKLVEIGANCVIEGDVVSDGAISLQKDCRIEGALIGADVEAEAGLSVDGPIYSRGALLCKGNLSAESLTATGNIVLVGDKSAEVVIQGSLIMARHGEIQVGATLKLAGRTVNVEQQKFYITQSGDQMRLSRVPFEQTAEQGVLLTTLTDSELERLIADLAVLEQ